MSIWASTTTAGHDPDGLHPMRGGQVRSYADGWSNHYPTTNGDVEQPAGIHLAIIPSFCVPGHADEDEEDEPTGPWLRLDVDTREHDRNDGMPTGRRRFASVILDPPAAQQLAADLAEWAAQDHTEPT